MNVLPAWMFAAAVVVAMVAAADVTAVRPTSVTVMVAVGTAVLARMTPAASVLWRPRYTFGRATVAVALVTICPKVPRTLPATRANGFADVA